MIARAVFLEWVASVSALVAAMWSATLYSGRKRRLIREARTA